MPGPGIHLMTLQQTINELRTRGLNIYADVLADERPFSNLGALGPDLFFFLGTGSQVFRVINRIFSFIKKVKEIFEAASDAVDSVGMPNLAALVEGIGTSVESAIVTFETITFDALYDLYEFFAGSIFTNSEIQENKPESEWGWGNILHSRITGEMASSLLGEANRTNNRQWHAYALGYITHLATDIAGHAYVNQVTGGQARAFALRHHLAENYMDSKVWYELRGEEIAGSRLDQRIEGVEDSGQLDDLAKMLSNNLLQFYHSSLGTSHQLPPEPSQDEIEKSYKAFKAILEFISGVLYIEPPSPPGVEIPPLPGEAGTITAEAAEAVEDALSSGGFNFWDILLGIILGIFLLFAFLVDVIRWIVDVAIGLGTVHVRAGLWYVQMILYTIYRFVIKFLTYSAITYPFYGETYSWLGSQFTTSKIPDVIFPHQSQPITSANYILQLGNRILTRNFSEYHHIIYPNTPLESPKTLSSPYANVTPQYFMNQALVSDVYRTNSLQAHTPAQLDKFNEELRYQMFADPNIVRSVDKAFGSAVDIAISLMVERGLPLVNYDIDEDRGYSYRAWKHTGGLPTQVDDPKWM